MWRQQWLMPQMEEDSDDLCSSTMELHPISIVMFIDIWTPLCLSVGSVLLEILLKKERSVQFIRAMVQKILALGKSCSCSLFAWDCSVPQIRQLCLLTLPLMLKVASSLKITQSIKSSSPSCFSCATRSAALMPRKLWEWLFKVVC